MNDVLNLAFIVQRLREEVPALTLIGGSVEFERASKALKAVPAAFLLPLAEQAERSPWGNQIVEQRVGIRFGVCYAVRNLADSDGTAAMQSLRPIRRAARNALLNWQPSEEFDGCEFLAGQLLTLDENSVLWWQDDFVTAHTIRSS